MNIDLMKRKLNNFFFILTKKNWLWFRSDLSGEIDWEWDRRLSDALQSKDCEIVQVGVCTTSVNGVVVWTANYPYTSGNMEGGGSGFPTLQTRTKLENKIKELKVREKYLEDRYSEYEKLKEYVDKKLRYSDEVTQEYLSDCEDLVSRNLNIIRSIKRIYKLE